MLKFEWVRSLHFIYFHNWALSWRSYSHVGQWHKSHYCRLNLNLVASHCFSSKCDNIHTFLPTNPFVSFTLVQNERFWNRLDFYPKNQQWNVFKFKIEICQSLWINRHIYSFLKEAFLGFQIEGFCWVIVLSDWRTTVFGCWSKGLNLFCRTRRLQV
jgi:hypothetical protein